MPCWMVQENHVSLTKPDMGVFKAALEAIGFQNFNENNEYARQNGRGAVFTADRFTDRMSVTVMPDGEVRIVSGNRNHTQEDILAASNGLKRAYSKASVDASAKRFGFKAVWKNDRQFELQKGR